MNDSADGSEKKQNVRPITERKDALSGPAERLANEFTLAASHEISRAEWFSQMLANRHVLATIFWRICGARAALVCLPPEAHQSARRTKSR
jgi:hypothetical protein